MREKKTISAKPPRKFPLSAALTLREHETELRQLALAQCVQALRITEQQIASLDATIEAARQEQPQTERIGWHNMTLMAYTQRIRQMQAHLRQKALQQQKAIAQAQQHLTEALKREKSVDTLKTKWQKAKTQHEWILDEAMIADVVSHKYSQSKI
jgi:flagellar export protein FliJ